MVKDSYEFSVDGLNALRNDLAILKRDIENVSKTVLRQQVTDFEKTLHRSSPMGLEYSINVLNTGNKAIIEQIGEQVIFTEFGTGWYGEINPRHPQEGEILAPDGEPYEVNKTEKDSTGWYYVDNYGKAQWTLGEPSGMQNYKAFQYVLQQRNKYANVLLKGVKK